MENKMRPTYDLTLEDAFFKYIEEDGTERLIPREELMLAKLLVDGVLFPGNSDQGPFFTNKQNSPETTTSLWVDCGDTFSWGCADCEGFTMDELPELFKMHMADNKWGSTKWCCKKRNLQPQKPAIKMMKDDNVWDEMMEALHKNGE